MSVLDLPTASGDLEPYRLGTHETVSPIPGPWATREVYAGVVEDAAVAWMPDGTIYATFTERVGTRAGWTIHTDGRPPIRHGLVPFPLATYRITADGTRGSAAVTDVRTDAWLLTGWDSGEK